MGFFGFGRNERESELEKVLEGMLFSDDVTILYAGAEGGKNEPCASPFYLIPVDSIDSAVIGLFNIEGRTAEVPIGFVQKYGFAGKRYYYLDINGDILESRYHADYTFLPLKNTRIWECIDILQKKTRQFSKEKMPVMGIEGKRGIHPVLLASRTNNGVVCKGLLSADKGIFPYTLSNSTDEQVKAMLENMHSASKTAEKTSPDAAASPEKIDWEEPKSIVKYLDQYVIGQEDAKKSIAVAFSNYMIRVRTKNDNLPKDNLLFIGPSGVGKTYMVSLLAKKASLPMMLAKLTGKSAEGYKGQNLSTIFRELREKAVGDAPYAVVFFDEIDKTVWGDWESTSYGARHMDEIIGWIDGTTIECESGTPAQPAAMLNTSNLLFITAGAFLSNGKSSLEQIIRKRLGSGEKTIGFGRKHEDENGCDKQVMHKVKPEDLVAYGLKAELVGRLPCIGVLNPLTLEDKLKILANAKDSQLERYANLLEIKGYRTKIDKAVLEVIAGRCPPETGARALSAICSDLFTEILFEPDAYADSEKTIHITKELAEKLINLYG